MDTPRRWPTLSCACSGQQIELTFSEPYSPALTFRGVCARCEAGWEAVRWPDPQEPDSEPHDKWGLPIPDLNCDCGGKVWLLPIIANQEAGTLWEPEMGLPLYDFLVGGACVSCRAEWVVEGRPARAGSVSSSVADAVR